MLLMTTSGKVALRVSVILASVLGLGLTLSAAIAVDAAKLAIPSASNANKMDLMFVCFIYFGFVLFFTTVLIVADKDESAVKEN